MNATQAQRDDTEQREDDTEQREDDYKDDIKERMMANYK